MPVKSQPSSTQLSYTAYEPASHNLGLSAHSWNASWPHRALHREKISSWPTLNVAKPRLRLLHLCGHCNSRLHLGCYCGVGEGRDSLFLPSCAPLFCATKRPNQILFFKLLKTAQARLFTHNQIHIFFSVQWLPRAKVQAGTLKLTWLKSPVGHLWCWGWFTQLGPVRDLDSTGPPCYRAPLCKLSCPCQLQQPTLPTANMSHVGRSLNIMPKCNTGQDAIKKKNIKSCWCKHYAFTSPSLTSLLHNQQQAAISLVISSASSNVRLPVFNPLCSPSYHPTINTFSSTISWLHRSFPLSPHIWLLDCFPFLSVNIFEVYLGLNRLSFPSCWWTEEEGEPAAQLALASLGSSSWTP